MLNPDAQEPLALAPPRARRSITYPCAHARFDEIEPHMEYILSHMDQLAPHCGALLRHLDALLLYCDDEQRRARVGKGGLGESRRAVGALAGRGATGPDGVLGRPRREDWHSTLPRALHEIAP
jgi:hypothetical protein